MATLVNRVEIGVAPNLVIVDLMQALGGLSVEIEPLRAPRERYLADGARILLTGPGASQRRVTVSGSGRWTPDLSALTLPGTHNLKVYWPNGTTTTLSVLTAGVARQAMDMASGTTAWSLVGTGVKTAGTAV
jgi:hypothetical protein